MCHTLYAALFLKQNNIQEARIRSGGTEIREGLVWDCRIIEFVSTWLACPDEVGWFDYPIGTLYYAAPCRLENNPLSTHPPPSSEGGNAGLNMLALLCSSMTWPHYACSTLCVWIPVCKGAKSLVERCFHSICDECFENLRWMFWKPTVNILKTYDDCS